MQTAPDPSVEDAPQERSSPQATDGDLVRAIRDDGAAVDAAFRPGLDALPALHRHIVRARIISARMAFLQRSEKIGFHTASLGDEAVIVGAALAAREADWVFPGAREWYSALARGMPLGTYVHHAFGSASDPAKGHQSPDHAPARKWNVVPPSGVVGAHVVQAVGAAWAAKIQKADVATVALFGAEVAESGDFHNAMNFAGVFKAPVVFVCRSKAGARSGARIVDRAVAYGIASARVDGTDALAVYSVVRAALARAADGKGTTLIETVTPALEIRDLDDAALSSGKVLDLGPSDPLVALRRLARDKRIDNALDDSNEASIANEVRAELDAAIAAAEAAGAPRLGSIFEDVYANKPAHLAAQEREAETLMATRTAARTMPDSGG
jgi:pyruvate dehydrogenase E1 component alpha subunit